MSGTHRYVLISPCRDEAECMRLTLDSVAAQTVPPALWVVVDDGSTDATPAILQEYCVKLPYLRVLRRADRGRRSVGPGVVEAFRAGLETVDLDDFEYLCKLDLDLDLPPRYFELLIQRMRADPRIGTTSGKPYFVRAGDGALVPEVCGDEMSVGMTKFYRTTCFREIGGFVREVMWDGIDCHRCRMLGWIAESVDSPGLRFRHLRPMGSSQKGLWTGRVRSGYGQYFMGTSPLYLAASAAFRLFKPPVLYGSAAMLWGYVSSLARGLPRYNDPEFRRFLRRYQRQCLLRGKREATRRLNEARAPVWRSRAATPSTQRTRSGPGEFLDLPFDRVSMQAAVERCLEWCLGPRAPHTVITANAAILCMLRRDPALREACRRGDLIVPDGMSVVWTSRIAGVPFPERVTGVDLTARLLEAGSQRRLRAFFLGARPEVVAELARRCARDYPGLVVAGFRDGYFGPGEEEGIVEEIRRAAPHMLFVGMPSPFKETWCERHRAALDVPLIMGVGGTFDVLAGYVPRAPRLVQSLGLEWSWRLAMEPRKLWKRYLATNSEYLWLAAGEILKRRAGLAGRAGLQ
jgi:exopolysaccharide biosynthesis WecB/TagA/CpsF family protein